MRIPANYRQRQVQNQLNQQTENLQTQDVAQKAANPFEGFSQVGQNSHLGFLGEGAGLDAFQTPRYYGQGGSPEAKEIAEDQSRWNSFNWGRATRTVAGRDLWQGKTERDLGSRTREWGQATTGAQEEKPKSWQDDWSANATLLNVGAGARSYLAELNGDVEIPGGISGSGNVYAGGLEAITGANVGIDLKNGDVTAGGFAKAGAHLVGARGSIGGEWGTDQQAVGAKLLGNAFVGAEAGANAGVTLNPRSGTAKIGAGVDAFAGAKASATFRPNLRLMGEDISTHSGITGEVYAGVGAKAKADIGFDEGRFKANVEIGAALGVGAGVKLSVDVNVVGVAKAAGKAATQASEAVVDGARQIADQATEVGGYVADRAQDAVTAVGDVTSAAYDGAKDGVKSAFKSVKSFFSW
ncbi:MAG: hypothetical protein CMH58_05665 [Myxococcales bacterium]|nr:hypothetical protein [Myxococcales bacterium]